MKLNRRTFVTSSAAVGASALAGTTSSRAAENHQATSKEPTGSQHTTSRRMRQEYFIPAPVERVWRAFTDEGERKIWFGYPGSPLQNALEVIPLKSVRTAVDHPGMPGPYETTATFEAVEGGTRLTHTLSGYGEGLVWENAIQSSANGIDEMIADLALYIRTGVAFPRHTGVAFPHRSPHPNEFIKGARSVPGGLEVFEVSEGLAAEAGLQPGDIIVAIDDAGVFSLRDVRMLNLNHAPGDTVEVTWVRGNKLHTAKGRLRLTK